MARSETTWWALECTARKIDWKKATIYARIFHLSGGTNSDPNCDATYKRIGSAEKSGTHRITDAMLDAPKGTGR
jgi:hypothetical protein